MESMLWFEISKALPEMKSYLEGTSYEDACIKSEDEFFAFADQKAREKYLKFKDYLQTYLEELIFEHSGYAFNLGIKYGMELKENLDELQGK